MMVPVLDALARQYPEARISVVSRPVMQSVAELLPGNVEFVGINPRDYAGLCGLERLYRQLRSLQPTHVCDLHDVLRTKYLRMRFHLDGIPVTRIHKDRCARRRFLHSKHKTQQTTTFARYADALRRLDFPVEIDPYVPFCLCGSVPQADDTGRGDEARIGIAPFAAHRGKVYPLPQMERVAQLLCERGARVFLFGAGTDEAGICDEWAQKYHGVQSMVGRLANLAEEMQFMASLNCLVSMDSANMHLASLAGVRVVSVWGATHPMAGFMGWGQSERDAVQLPLPCRPCSIYGNRPCRYSDWRCLSGIAPEQIVDRALNAAGA